MDKNHSEEAKKIIIKSALQLIAQEGFTNFKFSTLSKKSKLSTFTINKYFKTKDAILENIFLNAWTDIMNVINLEILNSLGADEITLLKKIFSITVGYLLSEQNKEIAVVLLFESRQRGYINRVIYPPPVENFIQITRNLFKSAQEKNILSKDLSSEEMETIFWSIGEETLYRNYTYKYKEDLGGLETNRAGDYHDIKRPLKLLEKVLEGFKIKN